MGGLAEKINNPLPFLGRVSRGISDTPLFVYACIPSVATAVAMRSAVCQPSRR